MTPARHRSLRRIVVAAIAATVLTASGLPAAGQEAGIELWADADTLGPGECTNLNWRSPAAVAELAIGSAAVGDPPVYAEVTGVAGFVSGSFRLCPDTAGAYALQLQAVMADGTELSSNQVTITVAGTTASTLAPAAPPYLVLTHSGRLNRALAASGGSLARVETLLDARYGVGQWELLDFDADPATATSTLPLAYRQVERDWISSHGMPRYVIIIGDPDVVPFGNLGNACQGVDLDPDPQRVDPDQDIAYTDDLYADLDDDSLHRPDIPVARVPDGDDMDLIEAVFAAAARPRPQGATSNSGEPLRAYSSGHPLRPYVQDMASRLVDHNRDDILPGFNPRITPKPADVRRVFVSAEGHQNADLVYFILHGSKTNTSRWTGEDPDVGAIQHLSQDASGKFVWQAPTYPPERYPVAITAAEASTSGLVVSEVCYAAYLDGSQTAADSVALAFLQSGAFGFIGSTAITYSWIAGATGPDEVRYFGCDAQGNCLGKISVGDPLGRGVQAFSWGVFERVKAGSHPLDAYFDVKQSYAGWATPMCGEEKALKSMVYYGLPPAGL